MLLYAAKSLRVAFVSLVLESNCDIFNKTRKESLNGFPCGVSALLR